MKRNNILPLACIAVAFILNIGVLFAQPASAPSNPRSTPAKGCWPPPCMPIDGGISFLIAAGVAYGGKKLHNHRKKNVELKEVE